MWGKRKAGGKGAGGGTTWYREDENHTFLITHPAVTDSGWGKNNRLIFTPRGTGMRETRYKLTIPDFIREYNYQREK